MKGLNLTILILVLFHLSPTHTQLLKRIRDRLKQRLGGESIGKKFAINMNYKQILEVPNLAHPLLQSHIRPIHMY